MTSVHLAVHPKRQNHPSNSATGASSTAREGDENCTVDLTTKDLRRLLGCSASTAERRFRALLGPGRRRVERTISLEVWCKATGAHPDDVKAALGLSSAMAA